MNKTILLAVDAAPHITAATRLARELSHDTGDQVVVLHVHEFAIGRFGRLQVDCAEGEGERLASEVVADLRSAGVTATAEIREVGVGSATAIYAVIHSLLLKPLPYAHGERFVSVLGGSLKDPDSLSGLNLNEVRQYQGMRSFDAFGWMQFTDYNLTAPGEPLFLNGIGVTPELANSLGVNPRVGRWFRDLAGGPVAVISHRLWLRLGSDAAIVGKTITLSGRMYTVTGVMPAGFTLPLAGTRDE